MRSDSSIIESIFVIASLRSIFAIMGIFLPLERMSSRRYLMSSALLTKLIAIKSTLFSIPNCRSILSFSVRECSCIFDIGKLIPLFSLSSPPLTTSHSMQLSDLSCEITFSSIFPSSISTGCSRLRSCMIPG